MIPINLAPAITAAPTGNSFSPSAPPAAADKLREVFDDFVGQTFYGQMLSSLRNTVNPPAYFHGGRTEEVFQSQLDQILSERLADATAQQFTQPMYELFALNRK
ncbi:MAG: hypothetical protein AB7F89_22465 [Pirellulaceae bacterium]